MEDYKIKKLNGDNYHAWAIRARAFMVQKKCWEAIDPGYGPEMTDNDKRKNDEALTLMFLIVEDTFLDDIGDCIRARDAWNSLKDMHTKFGLLHVLQLMKDFFNIVMKPGETVQSYLARLMEIHRKLSNGGYAFTDREVALVMLIGLPKSYENLILNLEKDEASLTTTVVKSRLMIEEKRIFRNASSSSDNREEHALHVKGYAQKKSLQKNSMKKTSEPNNSNMKKQTRCFSCGEWGHISRNCDEARKQSQTVAKTAIDVKTNWALLANQKRDCDSTLWILDSGATEHMTSDKNKFTTLKNYNSVVEIANSERVEVTGIGDVTLSIHEDAEEKKNITLSNVLYVPNLGENLLSVGRIEERGFKVQFAEGVAKILSKTGEIVLEAKRKGRLYIVQEKQPTAYIMKKTVDKLWHRRLGHPYQNALKDNEHIITKEETTLMPNKPCTVCIQGKMKRKRFPKYSNTRAGEVLEIIHSDVVGKITPPSLGGSSYFVTFTDDFSRRTTVYPIKAKSEVFEKFYEYRCMAEKLHDKRIKILRSDNGGEFKSNDFDMYLAQHGIQRQLSVPESPQQNGISERTNQTLVNIARCLLIESGAGPEFWAEAVSTASYLHNRRPSAAIGGNVPEEIWLSKEVDLNHLRIFGCRAWSHVRSFPRRGKFEPKATECIFAGYPDGIKGYKLWDLKEKKFLISRDVIFEEDIFPLKSDHHQPHKNDDNVVLSIENEEVTENNLNANTETDQEESQVQNTADYEDPDEKCQCPGQHINQLDAPNNNTQDHPNRHAEEIELYNEEETDQSEETETRFEASTSCKQTSTRTIKVPGRLNDYVLYNAKEVFSLNPKQMIKDPMTVKEALESRFAKSWLEAMKEEMNNLTLNQTWELVPRPESIKPIGCKWIFKTKHDEDGNISKFKARLVAKGYTQAYGKDFSETFSPVIKIKSIRILLALAVEMKMKVHQMDITSAYLNGTLKEDVYMLQPEGYCEKGKEHLVCHLKRSLYGLKQSGREWNNCLDTFMKECGLLRSKNDPCIYFHPERNLYVGIYVDDMLIIGKIESIDEFKTEVMKRFRARDLGEASEILSIKIDTLADGSLSLNQTAYIEEILETFEASSAKGASTPLDPSVKHQKANDSEWEFVKKKNEIIPYKQAIGSLLYLSCGTRPDIAYASAYMSQFNERPTDMHWRSIKHIFRYLKETKNLSLHFKQTGKAIEVFSDSDWGSNLVDRKSFGGYVVKLAGGAVSWSSKKQSTVALSSAEAEYLAVTHVAKEVLWIKGLLEELGIPKFISPPVKISVDNQAAIFIASSQTTSERSKHIDIKHHFIRECVEQNIMCLDYVNSKNNVADLLTKNVSKKTLQTLRSSLGLTN